MNSEVNYKGKYEPLLNEGGEQVYNPSDNCDSENAWDQSSIDKLPENLSGIRVATITNRGSSGCDRDGSRKKPSDTKIMSLWRKLGTIQVNLQGISETPKLFSGQKNAMSIVVSRKGFFSARGGSPPKSPGGPKKWSKITKKEGPMSPPGIARLNEKNHLIRNFHREKGL